MSLLEELINRPLDQISDEELDEIIMKGRLAAEQPKTTAKGRTKKEPTTPAIIADIDLDAFD